MRRIRLWIWTAATVVFIITVPANASAWYEETHLAIAKAAGYYKWYNACAADMIRIKAPDIEVGNHYVNNSPGVSVTPEMVLSQVDKYDKPDDYGHLYGAIIASLRDYLRIKLVGEYAEHHLAFCAHYVGDLSMPLHNTQYSQFNQTHHTSVDGIINGEVLDNLKKIKVYTIKIKSERDLAKEIARIARLSAKLGFRIEKENRLLTKEEAYNQIGHSVSLFKAILKYAEGTD